MVVGPLVEWVWRFLGDWVVVDGGGLLFICCAMVWMGICFGDGILRDGRGGRREGNVDNMPWCKECPGVGKTGHKTE